MKKILLASTLVSLSLFLAGCTQQELSIEGNPPSAEETTETTPTRDLASLGTLKKRVTDAKEKYPNPKQSSLREANYTRKGMAYMQYDKETDKTSFWLETDGLETSESDKNYTVWLTNTKLPKDDTARMLEVGTIEFDEEGSGVLYYEFAEAGEFYDYLTVSVSTDSKGEEVILTASFNPKLN